MTVQARKHTERERGQGGPGELEFGYSIVKYPGFRTRPDRYTTEQDVTAPLEQSSGVRKLSFAAEQCEKRRCV